jgi:hypothetical protein
MKKVLFAAAIAAVVMLPSVAQAQGTAAVAGPVVCRAPKTGETSNATMGSTALICRPLDMDKVNAAMTKMHAAMQKMQASSTMSYTVTISAAALTGFSSAL